jgi:hypothetical protein
MLAGSRSQLGAGAEISYGFLRPVKVMAELFLRHAFLFGIVRVGLHSRRRVTLRTFCRRTAGRGIGPAGVTLWLALVGGRSCILTGP